MKQLKDYTKGSASIVQKRIDQYNDLYKVGVDEPLMRGIFNSIPMNFRKMYMSDDIFEMAVKKCGSLVELKKRMLECLEYCVEVIG